MTENNSRVEIGEKFFRYRDYTPVPLILLLFIYAEPGVVSATFGLLLVTFGELIRIYSVAFIGAISRTRKNRTGGRLIKEGPFAYVRNPLYVGNFFITLGIAVYGARTGIILLAVILFAIQYFFIVQYEESLLKETFGEEYDQYCAEVPPFIPRRTLAIDQLQWPGSFSGALQSERKTLLGIGTMLLLLMVLA